MYAGRRRPETVSKKKEVFLANGKVFFLDLLSHRRLWRVYPPFFWRNGGFDPKLRAGSASLSYMVTPQRLSLLIGPVKYA